MNITTIFTSFIVSMLSVSYPILSQVVARLDDKYSSSIIVDLFNKEKDRRFFLIFLKLALVFLSLHILNISPLPSLSKIDFVLESSATYILGLCVILLVIFFFKFVNKILIYYTPTRFLEYLISGHNKKIIKGDFSYFKAISVIFRFSIRQQNDSVARTISDFMYGAFKKKREETPDKEIQYPFAYYEITYQATEELCSQKNNRLKYIESRTVGGIWLLGELQYYKISGDTFFWLWQNLKLAIDSEKDNMVIAYWQQADQYFSYCLPAVIPKYRSGYLEITNNELIKLRVQEQEQFLEFNYALGGLLLYKERLNCLDRIFKYTTSIPPKYELLPESMNEIFKRFFQFWDPHQRKYTWISNRYPFPELEGLNSDGLIQSWICKYIAILFLRQYKITTYAALDLPLVPSHQNEKRLWIENIDFFRSFIEEAYNNDDLKLKIGLSFLNDEWCQNNERIKPLDLIGIVKQALLDSFENTEVMQDISEPARNQFYESSRTLLGATMKDYESIKNNTAIIADFSNWFIYGGRTIIDRGAFAENQDVHYINFDSILASSISKKYANGISETFFYNKSSSYILQPEDVFPAIDQLNIDSNEYVIITFGLDLSYHIEGLKVPGLDTEKYKNINIISFLECNYFLVGESLFIMRKKDLPFLIYNNVSEEEIEKYSLNKIDESFNIYASILNLNEQETLQKELIESARGRDLKKSALLSISINTEIRWRKKTKNIFIRMYSQFEERGLPSSLSEIHGFEQR